MKIFNKLCSYWQQKILLAAGLIGIAGLCLISIGFASQQHAPILGKKTLGKIPSQTHYFAPGSVISTSVAHTVPVSIDIPSIQVNSHLIQLGLNPNGSVEVPSLFAKPSQPGWYKYSPVPGQIGPAVILGHIDTYKGPSIFFRLGLLRPGNHIYVTLSNQTTVEFQVNAVASYPKTSFPTGQIYGNTSYPALRLITCGGAFDSTTHSYLSSTVIYASLMSSSQNK